MLPHRSFVNRMHTFNCSRDGTPQAAGPRKQGRVLGAAAVVPIDLDLVIRSGGTSHFRRGAMTIPIGCLKARSPSAIPLILFSG